MKSGRRTFVLCVLLIYSMACGLAGQVVPQGQITPQIEGAPQEEITTFSAQADSPASVNLQWPAVTGASRYLLEGQYGGGDYFQVANLTGDQTEYAHYVVPGSSQITYRLSAIKDSGNEEIDSVVVKIPELVTNPLVVQSSAFAPKIEGNPEIPVLPTLDPLNPDLSAASTAIAEFTGSMPEGGPQVQPISVEKAIGPEGGEVTLTDPNNVVYTLSIPASALDEPVTIRLSPIESLSNGPFAAGILAGVQIHPPIPFAGPLNLKITLPPESPATNASIITGYTISSVSNELSLTPVYDEGGNTFIMNTSWGDTLGLASATLAEIETQTARIPSDAVAQMAQQLAALRAIEADPSPEGDAQIAVQVMQGFLQQAEGLTAQPASRGGGLAVPVMSVIAAPAAQYESPAKLFRALLSAEFIWNWLQQMLHLVPGAPPPPGEVGQMLTRLEKATVEGMIGPIKDFIDNHDGCRTGLGLLSETLRQILRAPATPYQQALANNYRARFGPPPSLQCEFKLKISSSSIKEKVPAQDPRLGDSVKTYGVHSEPWPLDLVMREGKLLLRGSVGTQYDSWEWTFSNCPPTAQVRPFPTSLVWITDLSLVFDNDDRVTDFVLQGVTPDRISGSGGEGKTESPEAFKCKLVEVTPGANPTDVWGIAFASLHTPSRKMDNWVITGDDSYVATDTISGRVEGGSLAQFTENTTIVLTVNEK